MQKKERSREEKTRGEEEEEEEEEGGRATSFNLLNCLKGAIYRQKVAISRVHQIRLR